MGAYYPQRNQFLSVQPSVQGGQYRSWPGQNIPPPRAASANSYSYDYGAERVRDRPDGPPSIGLSEARRLHRQVYYNMSLGDLDRLAPAELGHAAAYQAYIKVMDDPPVPRNLEYERELLIGQAVAEASRLAQQGGRDQDIQSYAAASEAAARTASRIFTEASSEFATPSPYRMGGRSEPYDWEEAEPGYPRRRPRASSHSRRPAFVDTPTMISDSDMDYDGDRFAQNSAPSEYPLGRSSFPSSAPIYPPTPYPGSTRHIGTTVMSNTGSNPWNTAPPQVYQLPQGDPSFNTALIPAPSFGRPRSSSFSYPQQHSNQPLSMDYNSTPYGYPQGVQPGQTIVIKTPRKHRHKHRHRHRSRSR